MNVKLNINVLQYMLNTKCIKNLAVVVVIY